MIFSERKVSLNGRGEVIRIENRIRIPIGPSVAEAVVKLIHVGTAQGVSENTDLAAPFLSPFRMPGELAGVTNPIPRGDNQAFPFIRFLPGSQVFRNVLADIPGHGLGVAFDGQQFMTAEVVEGKFSPEVAPELAEDRGGGSVVASFKLAEIASGANVIGQGNEQVQVPSTPLLPFIGADPFPEPEGLCQIASAERIPSFLELMVIRDIVLGRDRKKADVADGRCFVDEAFDVQEQGFRLSFVIGGKHSAEGQNAGRAVFFTVVLV